MPKLESTILCADWQAKAGHFIIRNNIAHNPNPRYEKHASKGRYAADGMQFGYLEKDTSLLQISCFIRNPINIKWGMVRLISRVRLDLP